MSTTRLGVIEGAGAVRRMTLRVEHAAAIDSVWEALTTVKQLSVWWPDWQPGGLLEPKPGGRIVIADGAWLDGQITTWAPPYLLAFTWNRAQPVADWFEPKTQSLLRADLVELAPNRTLLTLVQFASAETVVGGTAGWHQFAGERLKNLLEGQPQDERPERFAELVALYEHSGAAP